MAKTPHFGHLPKNHRIGNSAQEEADQSIHEADEANQRFYEEQMQYARSVSLIRAGVKEDVARALMSDFVRPGDPAALQEQVKRERVQSELYRAVQGNELYDTMRGDNKHYRASVSADFMHGQNPEGERSVLARMGFRGRKLARGIGSVIGTNNFVEAEVERRFGGREDLQTRRLFVAGRIVPDLQQIYDNDPADLDDISNAVVGTGRTLMPATLAASGMTLPNYLEAMSRAMAGLTFSQLEQLDGTLMVTSRAYNDLKLLIDLDQREKNKIGVENVYNAERLRQFWTGLRAVPGGAGIILTDNINKILVENSLFPLEKNPEGMAFLASIQARFQILVANQPAAVTGNARLQNAVTELNAQLINIRDNELANAVNTTERETNMKTATDKFNAVYGSINGEITLRNATLDANNVNDNALAAPIIAAANRARTDAAAEIVRFNTDLTSRRTALEARRNTIVVDLTTLTTGGGALDAAARAEIARLTAEVTRLTADLTAARANIPAERARQAGVLRTELATANTRVVTIDAQLAIFNECLAGRATQAMLTARITDLNRQRTAEIADSNAKIRLIDRQILGFGTSLRTATPAMAAVYTERIRDLNAERVAEVTATNARVTALDLQVAALNTTLASGITPAMSATYTDRIRDLNAQRTTETTAITDLNRRIFDLSTGIGGDQAVIDLQNRLNAETADLANYVALNAAATPGYQRAIAEINTLNGQIASLGTLDPEKSALERLNAVASAAQDNFDRKNADLTAKNALYGQEKLKLENEIRAKLQELEKDLEPLKLASNYPTFGAPAVNLFDYARRAPLGGVNIGIVIAQLQALETIIKKVDKAKITPFGLLQRFIRREYCDQHAVDPLTFSEEADKYSTLTAAMRVQDAKNADIYRNANRKAAEYLQQGLADRAAGKLKSGFNKAQNWLGIEVVNIQEQTADVVLEQIINSREEFAIFKGVSKFSTTRDIREIVNKSNKEVRLEVLERFIQTVEEAVSEFKKGNPNKQKFAIAGDWDIENLMVCLQKFKMERWTREFLDKIDKDAKPGNREHVFIQMLAEQRKMEQEIAAEIRKEVKNPNALWKKMLVKNDLKEVIEKESFEALKKLRGTGVEAKKKQIVKLQKDLDKVKDDPKKVAEKDKLEADIKNLKEEIENVQKELEESQDLHDRVEGAKKHIEENNLSRADTKKYLAEVGLTGVWDKMGTNFRLQRWWKKTKSAAKTSKEGIQKAWAWSRRKFINKETGRKLVSVNRLLFTPVTKPLGWAAKAGYFPFRMVGRAAMWTLDIPSNIYRSMSDTAMQSFMKEKVYKMDLALKDYDQEKIDLKTDQKNAPHDRDKIRIQKEIIEVEEKEEAILKHHAELVAIAKSRGLEMPALNQYKAVPIKVSAPPAKAANDNADASKTTKKAA